MKISFVFLIKKILFPKNYIKYFWKYFKIRYFSFKFLTVVSPLKCLWYTDGVKLKLFGKPLTTNYLSLSLSPYISLLLHLPLSFFPSISLSPSFSLCINTLSYSEGVVFLNPKSLPKIIKGWINTPYSIYMDRSIYCKEQFLIA